MNEWTKQALNCIGKGEPPDSRLKSLSGDEVLDLVSQSPTYGVTFPINQAVLATSPSGWKYLGSRDIASWSAQVRTSRA